MNIKIYDGRPQFYRYDLNQKVIIEDVGDVTCLHFATDTSGEAIVEHIYTEGDKKVCKVPNVMLTCKGVLYVYACIDTDDADSTIDTFVFNIENRHKPSNYDYAVGNEVYKWVELDKRISQLEEDNANLNDRMDNLALGIDEEVITNAVNNYLDENGIEFDTLEPQEDDIPKIYFTGTLPTTKEEGEVKVTIRYKSKTEDFKYPATLKVQGASSVQYPKKNFTLKMYEDEALENKVKYAFKNWGKLNKFVLKAHWIDHSHVRNVGTAKIWSQIVQSRSDYDSLPTELKNSPNNGATDGFTVKVFANGIYQGLYELIVPKDKLFGQDKDNPNHSIMNSELNNQDSCAFATTSPTISGNWSEELQDSLLSNASTSMANFIKFVASSTDEEFVANAENYFDVQSVIDYDIFARVFCIVDNLCRNQIFFKYDTKWFESVWDLDAVLGLPPTTRGFFNYDTEFQSGYIAYLDHKKTNMLYKRVEELFEDRFKARYWELRSNVLSIENIIDVYEKLTDVIKTYDGLLEEDYATTTANGNHFTIPYTNENNIQQIRKFVAQRVVYMDETINLIGDEVVSISATYTGEDVEEGTELSSLSGIVVTATYSNGDTKVVNDYELSGSIVKGNNTITVTYKGLTTTFTVVAVGVALPSGFNELPYVETNTKQYFDSEVVPTSTIGFAYKVSVTDDTDATLAGSTYTFVPSLRRKRNGVFVKRNGMESTMICNCETNVAYEFEAFINDNNVYQDGVSIGTIKWGDRTESYSILIGGWSNNGSFIGGWNGKIYYFKIYDNGVMIRNYIPCTNNEGVVGMYDTVFGVFYPSASNTPFIAGTSE